MTVFYKLDLTKTLTENVKAIVNLVHQERSEFNKCGDWSSSNIRYTLVLDINDWALLSVTTNSFDVTGLRLVQTCCGKEVHIKTTGVYNLEVVEQNRIIWEDHPSHRETRELIGRIARYKLERELGVKIVDSTELSTPRVGVFDRLVGFFRRSE